MRIHYFQHVGFEGLGSIEQWATDNSHQVTATRFFNNDPLPSVAQIDWLIIMGGPMNIDEEAKYPWLTQEKRYIEAAIQAGKIVLGICLGAQLIASVLGAKVYRNVYPEIGWFPVQKTQAAAQSDLFAAFPAELEVFHWHGDTFAIPSGATHLARSAACENQAFAYAERVIGLQFHLDMTRQSAQQLIQHCAADIVTGPFIQSAAEMLADEECFQSIEKNLHGLLDRLHCNSYLSNPQEHFESGHPQYRR